jgi:hypothetical protein
VELLMLILLSDLLPLLLFLWDLNPRPQRLSEIFFITYLKEQLLKVNYIAQIAATPLFSYFIE